MSTVAEGAAPLARKPVTAHRLRLWLTALTAAAFIFGVAAFGLDYYSLPLVERAFSPKHPLLRPGGTLGLRLGMFGVFLFICLYLYPLRKRWRWLARFGKTRNWLDFHVVFGLSAPLVITLHSSLKFQGLAGVAYWLMIAVMASGIVGRYLYAKIPRSLSSAELSLRDLEQAAAEVTRELERQPALDRGALERVCRLPSADRVARLSLFRVLAMMFWLDLTGVFRAAGLRRSGMGPGARLRTLGGLLRSGNPDLEAVVRLARQRTRIRTRVIFLDRTNEIFHLWHVVHRPFSYAFATLAIVHVAFMVMLGYY